MDPSTRFDTQIVGALPVLGAFLDLMDVSSIIDRTVPWKGEVPLGTIAEVLIANRLMQPKAMFRISEWAEDVSATDYFGVSAEDLNDDRLGRALERLAKHATSVQSELVMKATEMFDLQVDQIHYDITSVELFGAYERQLAKEAEATGPTPAYGCTKSGRKNLKQIQFGLNVTNDGGVPISHLPLNGNTAETKTHLQNLKELKRYLPKSNLLYVADSKLDVRENLLAIVARRGKFLCGGSFSPHLKERYLAKKSYLEEIDYYSKSQEKRAPEDRDKYKAFEVSEGLSGEADGKNIRLDYRMIFVWSERKQRDEAKTRERHIGRVKEEFEKVERNLNKFRLKTEKAIIKRLESIKGKYKIGSVFEYELTENQSGAFELKWFINQENLRKRIETEGVYILKTNLPKRGNNLSKILRLYRDQTQVERRFRECKGPLAVAPMHLEKPERIAGLLCIIVWALMIMALMERAIRKNLNGKPLYGLYPENRPSPAPTGKSLLDCYSTLCIVIMKDHGKVYRRLTELSNIQRKLLDLLEIKAQLRTFKKRCGT